MPHHGRTCKTIGKPTNLHCEQYAWPKWLCTPKVNSHKKKGHGYHPRVEDAYEPPVPIYYENRRVY